MLIRRLLNCSNCETMAAVFCFENKNQRIQMPAKETIPRLKVFPDDGKLWRIDWLGAIRSNPHQSSEPMIDVIISPLSSKQVTIFDEYKLKFIAPVGVGLLPFLRIGSLWKNGRPCPEFLGTEESLYNVNISSETVSYFRTDSDDNPELGFNILPRWEYDFSDLGMFTQCVSVKMGDDPYAIIIPAIELIRFYYAGSTNLTSLTLFGAYENYLNQIINPDHCCPVKRHSSVACNRC